MWGIKFRIYNLGDYKLLSFKQEKELQVMYKKQKYFTALSKDTPCSLSYHTSTDMNEL